MTDPNLDPQVRVERTVYELGNLALDLHSLLAHPKTNQFVMENQPAIEHALWLLSLLNVSMKQQKQKVA